MPNLNLTCRDCQGRFSYEYTRGKVRVRCDTCTQKLLKDRTTPRKFICRNCQQPSEAFGKGKHKRVICNKCKNTETVKIASSICTSCGDGFEYEQNPNGGRLRLTCDSCKSQSLVAKGRKSDVELVSTVLADLGISVSSTSINILTNPKEGLAKQIVDDLEMKLRSRGTHIAQNR